MLLPDGREYKQQAFQRVNWSRQTPRLIRAVQEKARSPAFRILTSSSTVGLVQSADNAKIVGSNPTCSISNQIHPIWLWLQGAEGWRLSNACIS